MKDVLQINGNTIKYLLGFMDTCTIGKMHFDLHDYIKMFPSGSLKAPKILEILEEELQMRYESDNDL